MTARVVGVDPSLSSTGLAIITRTEGVTTQHQVIDGRVFLTVTTLKPTSTGTPKTVVEEAERVADLVDQVCTSAAGAEHVYIESLALNSRTGKYAERAHLYFSLVAALHARRHTVTVLAPTTLKKRITGSGRADKDHMTAAIRYSWSSLGWDDGPVGGRSDRADASALAWCAALDQGWVVPPPATGSQSCAA